MSCYEVRSKTLSRAFKVRSGVADTFVISDHCCLAAHVWYGVSRTHDVMKEFGVMDFKNHPAMSSEYVKFLATNSGMELIEAIDVKIKTLKNWLRMHAKQPHPRPTRLMM